MINNFKKEKQKAALLWQKNYRNQREFDKYRIVCLLNPNKHK